jgi:hypothetical protein
MAMTAIEGTASTIFCAGKAKPQIIAAPNSRSGDMYFFIYLFLTF